VGGTELLTALVLAAVGAVGTVGPPPVASSQVEVRRVEVSFAFAGRDVFLFGHVPNGTTRVASVMEGPAAGVVRLMKKGRVGPFWLGTRQYRLEGVPGVYLVNLSCPLCNGLTDCHHPGALEACNRLLAADDQGLGPDALWSAASLTCLSGRLDKQEAETALAGFWSLQEERGLFGVRTNAIRISPAGIFYHQFALPAGAPEGRYRITTYFFSDDGLLAIRHNEVFVRKASVLFWLSRLAERRALLYGMFAVFVALAAGWMAGTLFKRSSH
jgi:hypothetical protein